VNSGDFAPSALQEGSACRGREVREPVLRFTKTGQAGGGKTHLRSKGQPLLRVIQIDGRRIA